jgi:hypothetical protein
LNLIKIKLQELNFKNIIMSKCEKNKESNVIDFYSHLDASHTSIFTTGNLLTCQYVLEVCLNRNILLENEKPLTQYVLRKFNHAVNNLKNENKK